MFAPKKFFSVLFILLLCGCAEVPQTPVNYEAVTGLAKSFSLKTRLELKTTTPYSSDMPANSTWVQVGVIPQGDVYKIKNSVFSVEGRQVHEAYVVVKNDSVIGFYLPYEHTFSALNQAEPLSQ